jgi:hypothetical protein
MERDTGAPPDGEQVDPTGSMEKDTGAPPDDVVLPQDREGTPTQ